MMKVDPKRQRQIEIEPDDEIDFRPVKDLLARNVRRPVEPGVWRSLVIAMIVGVGMGLFIYFFKPTPKAAQASPQVAPRMMNSETTGQESKQDLFQLPDWDQAAYERDKASRRK